MANSEKKNLFDIFQDVANQRTVSHDNSSDTQSSIDSTLAELLPQGSQAGRIAESQPQGGIDKQSMSSMVAEVTAQANQLFVGASQTNLSARAGSDGQSEDFPSSGPNVINMSAEAGSRLNSTPTTVPVEQRGSSASGDPGGGSSILSLVSSVFGGGLGAIPLISGLMGLFGGGKSEPPPLEKYVKPDQLYFTGADTSSGVEEGDYDQYGMPRPYSDAVTGTPAQTGSLGASATAGSQTAGAGSPINVTIQALDSQSFLDRSSDIAQAVRQAMLNSSSINDVVNDL